MLKLFTLPYYSKAKIYLLTSAQICLIPPQCNRKLMNINECHKKKNKKQHHHTRKCHHVGCLAFLAELEKSADCKFESDIAQYVQG